MDLTSDLAEQETRLAGLARNPELGSAVRENVEEMLELTRISLLLLEQADRAHRRLARASGAIQGRSVYADPAVGSL